jgi:hypothetical protein
MKKLRILMAVAVAAAACLVATPASSTATPPPLTITCTRSPASCLAYGQLGPNLFGGALLTTQGSSAGICLDPQCNGVVLLEVSPGFLEAVATTGGLQAAGALVILTPHLVFGEALLNGYLLSITGTGGLIGTVLVKPDQTTQCLILLDHLKLSLGHC